MKGEAGKKDAGQRTWPTTCRLTPARLDWPSAVGNFVLNFSTLDYLVFALLKDNLPPEEFARMRDWHLKDRLSRIAQILADENYPTAKQTAFSSLVTLLDPIRELRNQIAHGHMCFHFDPNTKQGMPTIMVGKDLDTGSTPDSKHIHFEDLLSALKTLTCLIEQFQQFAGFTSSDHSKGPALTDAAAGAPPTVSRS
jgi:hypothetical protein